ncbi:uncharacterized protein BJ212DRAFT_1480392 [Suillus subaureus]|uniref:Uncharacterized protein n=1 Tax=Suillus subaureus TaxID=48587 RepID=A0A9P7ECF6_9AGAM|nr:uncharacterized protein BJ212DRAFT_1480392 [Suillus subaureus]KAG1817163.1 hypothetical protein BJ212DRAFT_1480392 [Suillus subaureus]
MDTIYSVIEDCHNSINALSPSLETIQDYIHTLSLQLTTQPDPPPPTLPRTTCFSDIVTAHVPGMEAHLYTSRGSPQNTQVYTHNTQTAQNPPSYTPLQIPLVDEALARSATHARQILLDPIPGNPMFPPGISHDDAIHKIRLTIKTALTPNDHNENIIALLQLCNGGLIMELDSEETVLRLQDSTTRKKLIQALEFSVTFKDRTYTLVAQFIPINLLIEQPSLLHLVEGKNRLDDNLLASMRWIKPLHKRPPSQTMAFALLQESTNDNNDNKNNNNNENELNTRRDPPSTPSTSSSASPTATPAMPYMPLRFPMPTPTPSPPPTMEPPTISMAYV